MPHRKQNDFLTCYIRLATLSDLTSLVAIEQAVFPETHFHCMTRRQYQYALTKANAQVYVLDGVDGVVASMVLFFRNASNYSRLYSIAVSEMYQSRGWGMYLLQYAEQVSLKMGLLFLRQEVRADNQKLLDRYAKNGYVTSGVGKSYYPDGGDCIKLIKELKYDKLYSGYG